MRKDIVVLGLILIVLISLGCIQEAPKPAACTKDAEMCPDVSSAGGISPETIKPKPTLPPYETGFIPYTTTPQATSTPTTIAPAPTPASATTTPPETTTPLTMTPPPTPPLPTDLPAPTISATPTMPPTPPAPTPPGLEPGETNIVIIEESDDSFTWTDECVIQDYSGASGGYRIICPDPSQPPVPGATITVIFKGTAVSLIYVTCPWCGIAKIEIDGTSHPAVDTYSDKNHDKKIKLADGLTNTEHTMIITAAEKSNPLSNYPDSVGYLVLDAVEITVS